MADSVREKILKSIHSKLAAIRGDETYIYGLQLQNVQRYIHEWSGDEHVINKRAKAPCILIRVIGESGDSQTVDGWLCSMDVDLEFVLRGAVANDSDVNSALADMMRALFVPPFDGFGGNAREVTWVNRLVDPQTAMPADGIHLTLTLKYEDQIGDPYSGV